MSRLEPVVIAVTALLLGASGAAAQQAAPDRSKQQLADELHRQAMALEIEEGKLLPAARLLVKEARLRGDQDPATVDCLTNAAKLFFYAGRRSDALFTMEQAALKAIARGDLVIAADRYMLAAWMAKESGRPDEANRLVHEVMDLAALPGLSASERDAIKARLPVPTAVGAR